MNAGTTLTRPLVTPSDLSRETSDPAALQEFREFLAPLKPQEQLIAEISTDLAPLIKNLDSEDRAEFFRELADALKRPGDERLQEVLHAWFLTSSLLDDPLRREILLGGSGPEDFIEVSRPE